MVKVAPSILSADFSKLGEEIKRLEHAGADWIHIDVMDGVFVPNITIGQAVVKNLRPCTALPFDVHLMITKPERYVKEFAAAGADYITIHQEASDEITATLEEIHACGKKAGLSLNPETSFNAVIPYLDKIDLLLVMTVHPGFGGQAFMAECLPKVQAAKNLVEENGYQLEISVDGGINYETGQQAVTAGASVLAAGSAIFKAPNMQREIKQWHELSRQ